MQEPASQANIPEMAALSMGFYLPPAKGRPSNTGSRVRDGVPPHLRQATAHQNNMQSFPDFLIIGAQKCGTTWLHECLSCHPGITMPGNKDGGFFCYEATRTERALADYAEQFADQPASGDLRGESTAAYFWTPSGSEWDHKPPGFEGSIPERVRETLGPETRLLLCLRNPVERAVSAWFHHVRQGDLDPATPLLDAGDFMGLIDMGFYARHLRNWLAVFPIDSFCILILEDDIARMPAGTIRRVYRFLGVHDTFLPRGLSIRAYTGPDRLRTREGIRASIGSNGERLLVDGGTLAQLATIYREDVGELEDLLGRDVRRLWRF